MQPQRNDAPARLGSEAPQDVGWRGILDGLMPLAVLAVIAALGIAVTIGIRLATAARGFDVAQTGAVSAMAGAIVVAAVAYTVACVRALRRVRAMELAGNLARARGALWGLALTALVVVLPVVLAAVIPQHPAP